LRKGFEAHGAAAKAPERDSNEFWRWLAEYLRESGLSPAARPGHRGNYPLIAAFWQY
jgi:hypothetical protein